MLFGHRHPDESAPMHQQIVEWWHSHHPTARQLQIMGFRECAKSTLGEEALVIMASLKSFRNCVIIGENEARAADRLNAVKYEILNNERLVEIFGDQMGDVWGFTKIVLKNGVVIHALGRRQEVRGMKHLDIRPDLLWGDDLEAPENIKDEEARQETLKWLFAEVIPALDKNYRARIHATPLDREALPMTLARMSDWTTLRYPIKFKDQTTGAWRPTWPSRYPLSWVDEKESSMQKLGLHHDFMREYMCEAEDPTKKIFTAGMFKVVPREHVWQSAYVMLDPARTTLETSATTGWAVFSWIGNRLVIWDGGGDSWKPDEQVNKLFELDEAFHPVGIGVERDGLEEYLLQPIRQQMIVRGRILPIMPMRAPRDKLGFIKGLHPFFSANEIEFAKPLPVMVAQFLGYPTGKIDGPNALAYAPLMRPGIPMYENFGNSNVMERVPRIEAATFHLCVNATKTYTTGVLVQLYDGSLNVVCDYVREGDPGVALESIFNEAQLECGREPRIVASPNHWMQYDTVGLPAAIGKLAVDPVQGGTLLVGRENLRTQLERTIHGNPALRVSYAARWTLNGFSSGYAREVSPNGTIKQEAREGIYRVLMEGLETFAGLLKIGMLEPAGEAHYRTTESGVRYKTILPGKSERTDAKADWLGTGAVNDMRRFR